MLNISDLFFIFLASMRTTFPFFKLVKFGLELMERDNLFNNLFSSSEFNDRKSNLRGSKMVYLFTCEISILDKNLIGWQLKDVKTLFRFR